VLADRPLPAVMRYRRPWKTPERGSDGAQAERHGRSRVLGQLVDPGLPVGTDLALRRTARRISPGQCPYFYCASELRISGYCPAVLVLAGVLDSSGDYAE